MNFVKLCNHMVNRCELNLRGSNVAIILIAKLNEYKQYML